MVSPEERLPDMQQEMKRLPGAVLAEYQRASNSLGDYFGDAQMADWTRNGLELARHSVRSWESAAAFFRATPGMARRSSPAETMSWGEQGLRLCRDSPGMATAYFTATPEVLEQLSSVALLRWGEMGHSLYTGSWKSSALCAKFFQTSPALLRYLDHRELHQCVTLVARVAHRSLDLAMESLVVTPEVLRRLDGEYGAFLALGQAIADHSWRDVRPYLESAATAVSRVELGQRPRYLELAERLVRSGMRDAPTYLRESSAALAQLAGREHARVLEMARELAAVCPEAVPDFLESVSTVAGRVSAERLSEWMEEGTRLVQENVEGGRSYFRLETHTAERVLERISSRIDLERIREMLGLYCRALTGTRVSIKSTGELVGRAIGWVSEAMPTTEGRDVYLPESVDRSSDKRANFEWYKVMSTHQVGHLEFRSFDFSYDRPSTSFVDLRPRLAEWRRRNRDGGSRVRAAATDMERFFDLFQERRLALDIFTVLEDGRVDGRILGSYPGIRQGYGRVQHNALATRSPMETLGAREALVEFLVRRSLRDTGEIAVPSDYVEHARAIERVTRRVVDRETWVEDAAEGTIRIYATISELPNENVAEEDWDSLEPEDSEGEDNDLSEEQLQQLVDSWQQDSREGETEGDEEQSYRPSQEVEYRGDFKPELSQMLSQLQAEQAGEGESLSPSREELEEAMQKSAELDLQEGESGNAAGSYANNLLRELESRNQRGPEAGQGPLHHQEEAGGSLEASEPQSYSYPEWDFRAGDYKPRWCVVRERALSGSDSRFFDETLDNYLGLAGQIRREFEQLVPEMLRRVKRLPDGEDLDLDSTIESLIDRRSGVTPSEKIYWRRNKVERDVAVGFLLDMSASTAEAIDEARRLSDDWTAPDDPVEYMIWLRTRRGERMQRSYKRIIDVEKEGIVLLIHALEAIGDAYGLYGFSGYGRENVEFYVVKDIDERFSDRIKQRIERISPLHATRMGPAIRHATSKLERQEARTKLLFLLSDGRPQDRGYSREGVEKEYAVHDTRMALNEARQREITPFCLTVDRQGHDYLKTMCQDIGYEVLWDIRSLPRHLPRLYRRLTT